ncbi:MAG: M14 family zinc carboxypeptidase [Planctomycetota bacterium]
MSQHTPIEERFGPLDRYRQCPDFWIPTPERAEALIDSLAQAAVRTIGRSAGGRDIVAIEYGPQEPTEATTDNLQSALSTSLVPPDPTDIYPEAFYGRKRRGHPVVALQGAIHGSELTGTVASLNLCRVIETGRDLRGKAWPRLAELARQTRIVIIPWLNPDGTARWPLLNASEAPSELVQACTQGIAADGTPYTYPASKAIQPIPPAQTALMGAYYNDSGVNLQYDFCAVQRQPETTAWMAYYLRQRPDAVVVWHCNAGSLIGPPEAYLPVGHQHEINRIGAVVRRRLVGEGYPVGRLSWVDLPGMGKPAMNQVSAVYHVCGALPILCELPGGAEPNVLSCDQLLDIGLLTIEEILDHAHCDGLRPYEFWQKVKGRLSKESE